MRTKALCTSAILAALLAVSTVEAGAASETSFPSDWQNWTSISTTLTKIGALPGCDADVSSLPPIYQETVETYCGVRPGGPGKVAVLVRPGAVGAYKARSGGFGDGPNMILHLKDLKLLFVTGHKGGKAVYGVYSEDGKDMAAASGGLAPNTCRTCHSGYKAFCVNGQCGTKK
ncbi:MAG TPA: hypothetical protein ENJ37_06565 [Deltaproteobacteria bacterium]|nr:hypothetical protein [Deltaproteobacteria bacterium]